MIRHRMRAPALLAIAALAALAVSGCAPERDASWTPQAWPSTVVVTDAAPAPLDPATVAGLNPQRIRNDGVGIQARYALLPGSAPINARVLDLVRGAVSARSAAAGVAYTPAVFPQGSGMGARGCVVGSTTADAASVLADPVEGPVNATGTAVVCDVVLAAGDYFGERVRVVTGASDAVTADASTILYTRVDGAADAPVVTAGGLWNDQAAATLWTDVVEATRRDAGSLSLAPIAPPDAAGAAMLAAALDATTVGSGGELVITLAAGFTAPELAALGVAATTAPLEIAVPAAVAASLLTPFGADLVATATAGAPYAAPATVAAGFETVDCHLVPCVAMTYDDGPSDYTAGILDTLAAHHAAATFFAMGEKAAPFAAVMRRAVDEGHLVENHTWNHPHLPTLDAAQVAAQLHDTSAAITAATGRPVIAFRPPYGEYTAEVLAIAGLPAIIWDVDTLDWTGVADDVLTERAVDQPRPGSIVLQHDIQPNTARTVGAVYTGLEDRGFVLVNILQLFHGALPASGAWQSGR